MKTTAISQARNDNDLSQEEKLKKRNSDQSLGIF